jgi:hypothetical protein
MDGIETVTVPPVGPLFEVVYVVPPITVEKLYALTLTTLTEKALINGAEAKPHTLPVIALKSTKLPLESP